VVPSWEDQRIATLSCSVKVDTVIGQPNRKEPVVRGARLPRVTIRTAATAQKEATRSE